MALATLGNDGAVQTFLPDPDFSVTARLLDGLRLGKQRVEAMQILRALTREPYGWKSHPAVLMWSGFEEALAAYTLAMCAEWCGRGFADTVAISVVADLTEATGIDAPRSQAELAAAGVLPSWLGDEAFHASHRSALVRKDPEHYRPLFPDVADNQPYVWPVRSTGATARTEEAARKRRGSSLT